MNNDQRTRLEVMKALEKDFPDRSLEDLVHVARYMEHGGVEPEPPETDETRTWTTLADIPDTVRRVKDRDGDQIRRLTFLGNPLWVYTAPDYSDLKATDEDGPFTEVPS